MVRRADLDPRPHDWWSQLLDPKRHIGAGGRVLFAQRRSCRDGGLLRIALELPRMSDDESFTWRSMVAGWS